MSVRPPLVPADEEGRASSPSKPNDPTRSERQQQQQHAHAHEQQQAQGHEQQQQQQEMQWSSTDRLNVSVGLLYALCAAAADAGARAGFCVPRPQLLKRWLQAGVKMRQVAGPAKLIYPPSAHDYGYYKGSTVAYFLISEVKASLEQVLSVVNESE